MRQSVLKIVKLFSPKAPDPFHEKMAHDYRLLRKVVFDILELENSHDPAELSNLIESIDHGLLHAASAYKDPKEETELSQTEIGLQQIRIQRRLRDNFIETLMHDLRTPLVSAKLKVQLISKQPQLSEKLLGSVVQDIDRADQMIQNLLDAHLIRAGGKIPLKLVSCDLQGITQETLTELNAINGDRFILSGENSIPGIWDPCAIRRTLENLCLNAVKYGCPDSPISVVLRSDEQQATLSVHNNGVVHSEVDPASLLDPCHRTKTTNLSKNRGWGIGLTIVRCVAEAHGGKVTVESSLKHGTTFTVTLPKSD